MNDPQPDLPKPYVLELAQWVTSLTDERRMAMLHYLCGWKPDIIRTLKREARDE